MKRILFALSILIFSTAAFAQSEKPQNNGEVKATLSEYEKAKADNKTVVYSKYEEINASLDKNDLVTAKRKYAEAETLMKKALDAENKFMKKAKTDTEKQNITRKIDTISKLYDASKPFPTATDAKTAKMYAIYIMEFANVMEMM